MDPDFYKLVVVGGRHPGFQSSNSNYRKRLGARCFPYMLQLSTNSLMSAMYVNHFGLGQYWLLSNSLICGPHSWP